MRIVFATAELSPTVKVGGLADASAGLVKELRRQGVQVELAMPDYGGIHAGGEARELDDVVPWARTTRVRTVELPEFGEAHLLSTPGIERPHPYVDITGEGWPDNAARFFSFSAGVAALTIELEPDVLHVNDWHTGAVLGLLPAPPPSVFTIHNLAYQGQAGIEWMYRLIRRPDAFEWFGGTNPMTGAIALADRVVTVSPTFATEARTPEHGFGTHLALQARGDHFRGILNGIDTDVWDPESDRHLARGFGVGSMEGKRRVKADLVDSMELEPGNGPLIGMVTRLTDQKGVDLALANVGLMVQLGARFLLLGSGDERLADLARAAAVANPGRFAFVERFDEGLAHQIFAGADLFLVPSRFEPAGLTQMQAMRYGTIPVVTDVGGLHDTVIDDDADPENGNGFVASRVDAGSFGDAITRAVQAWKSTRRRGGLRSRGMSRDWSWARPADQYRSLYAELTAG